MVCACRKAQRIRGEGVGDIEGHMCIGVGDIAEFLVTSGKDAKYVTREEVKEILERAERKGYVHQITNLDGPNRMQLLTGQLLRTAHFPALQHAQYVPQRIPRPC